VAQVLETVPWAEVDIEVVGVEANHLGSVFPGSREALHHFMASHHYTYVASIREFKL
jgi:hypothetical protein